MANRSYIYGLKENSKPISIGEYPSKIPYAFKILASYETEAGDSWLFDKNVGITADFAKGRTALYFLLDFLSATNDMVNQKEFEEFVAETKAFLDPIDADRILLENGEIYQLYSDAEGNYIETDAQYEAANESACKACRFISEEIDFLKHLETPPSQISNLDNEKLQTLFQWIIDLKTNWETHLAAKCWRDVLYFQFK